MRIYALGIIADFMQVSCASRDPVKNHKLVSVGLLKKQERFTLESLREVFALSLVKRRQHSNSKLRNLEGGSTAHGTQDATPDMYFLSGTARFNHPNIGMPRVRERGQLSGDDRGKKVMEDANCADRDMMHGDLNGSSAAYGLWP